MEQGPSFIMPHAPAAAAESPATQGWPFVGAREGLGLQEGIRIFRKHLRCLLLCFAASLLLTTAMLLLTPPIYTGKTTLLIERHLPQVLNFHETLGPPSDSETYDFYKTQYEVLKSRTLAARVIQEQQLLDTPPFAVREQVPNALMDLWRRVRGWTQAMFTSRTSGDRGERSTITPDPIDIYLAMLEVQPVQRTQLVNVAFHSPSPDLSARLANAHAQAYIRRGVELRTRTNEEAQGFLEEKLVELKKRLEQSEEALNRYRHKEDIISLGDKENIVVERLADLNRRLTAAEAERIGLEGQARSIRQGQYEAIPAVINNTLIQTLTAQAARLEADFAQLATQYKVGHPRLDQLKAQVDETTRRLRREIRHVVAAIESAYRTAVATEQQLRAKMQEQKAATLRLKNASIDYAILARDVDTNRQLYDSVLQRMKETGVAAELRASNVSIIDGAEPPRHPSRPRTKRSLLLGACIGLLGGMALTCLREYLDHTLKTSDEVQSYLQVPNLSSVPDFLRIDWWRRLKYAVPATAASRPSHQLPTRAERGLVLARHPLLAVTEAYRTLRTAILLSRAEEPPRRLLFTSAAHGEGKTASVINAAIVFAQMGVKVLVIDADLRRPQCHRLLGGSDRMGLTEILTGACEVKGCIHPTYIANLFFVASGTLPPNPADLLGSQKMRDMLSLCEAEYDYILIDTPPVLPVSDAVLLSTMVDGVVLVVDAQGSPKQLVREACARLHYARAKILGTLLNRVDTRDRRYATYYWPHTGRDAEMIAEPAEQVSASEGR
jgi:succinoglycan biosynthesis transport protein ExoP